LPFAEKILAIPAKIDAAAGDDAYADALDEAKT
jgi:hypothetical protein